MLGFFIVDLINLMFHQRSNSGENGAIISTTTPTDYMVEGALASSISSLKTTTECFELEKSTMKTIMDLVSDYEKCRSDDDEANSLLKK